MKSKEPSFEKLIGYERADGKKGIRNLILVAYLVECAHHVAREIAYPFRSEGVQVIGFGGCYPNEYAGKMMKQLCTHPNVGAVLLVSLGCESFNKNKLEESIVQSGRPVNTLTIQKSGGTLSSIKYGQQWIQQSLIEIKKTKKVTISIEDLIIGTICGGSDATSGITANPAVGLTYDRLVNEQCTVMFEETGEMIGCQDDIIQRTDNPKLADEIKAALEKAAIYYTKMGYSSFAAGNADGGLSTIEEKSLGAYSKGGTSNIVGLLKPGDLPNKKGLFLLDIIPDGEPKFGYPNINDNSEISELIASGCHIILFTTGRGSVVGSAISPVIKICGNPVTYERMADDMDINAGKVLTGNSTLKEIADEIYDKILLTASGMPTSSERLGHQESVITYKSFEPLGQNCLID